MGSHVGHMGTGPQGEGLRLKGGSPLRPGGNKVKKVKPYSRMAFYKVRVTAVNDLVTRERVQEFCRKEFGGFVFMVHETEANRPHYQGRVWWEKSQQTLRDHLISFFNVHGNQDYGVGREKDPESHMRYLCKGPTKKRGVLPDVVYSCGLDIDVSAYHEAFWEENKRIKAASANKGKTTVELVMQRVRGAADKLAGNQLKREVAQQLVNVLKDSDGGVTLWQARGYYNKVMLRLDGEFERDFIDQIIFQT